MRNNYIGIEITAILIQLFHSINLFLRRFRIPQSNPFDVRRILLQAIVAIAKYSTISTTVSIKWMNEFILTCWTWKVVLWAVFQWNHYHPYFSLLSCFVLYLFIFGVINAVSTNQIQLHKMNSFCVERFFFFKGFSFIPWSRNWK